ncbi:MAG: DNA repair protein RadA [Armatimonadetes bacterium]|nr:DNA repair protein RadA [Armatimonadota bacterium]
MDRTRVKFVCQNCGHETPKWLGRCPGCGEWNTIVEEVAVASGARGQAAASTSPAPLPLVEVDVTPEPRVPTGIGEMDRVLGGGIVPGSLVLLGGDPGIGKSTLLLQTCDRVARQGRTVLYVSGEESLQQTRLRAERLGVAAERLLVAAETDLNAIRDHIARVSPVLVVIDSIQTTFMPEIPSSPGSVGQVRECAGALLRVAKQAGGPAIILVGHVTKDGQIAGPRVLEHVVDAVLYFEGETYQTYRILRAVKNRFGSTNEIGVFEMVAAGLAEVANPSAVFLSQRPAAVPGSAVVCAMEGTRPLLVEVQALVASTVFGTPRRTASGVDYQRLVLLLAVLEKRAGLHLGMQDVYASVAGGVKVSEPAADLGIAVAIASSHRDRPADPEAVFIGEVGLGGEVRAVAQVGRRVAEAASLGFRRCVVPRQTGVGDRPSSGTGTPAAPDGAAIQVVPVGTVGEALAIAVG